MKLRIVRNEQETRGERRVDEAERERKAVSAPRGEFPATLKSAGIRSATPTLPNLSLRPANHNKSKGVGT